MENTRLNIEADEKRCAEAFLNIEADKKRYAEAFNNAMRCIEVAEREGRFFGSINGTLSFEAAVTLANQGRNVFITDDGEEAATTTMDWHNRSKGKVTYLGKHTFFIVSVDGESLTVEDQCFSENGIIDTNYTIDNAAVVAI